LKKLASVFLALIILFGSAGCTSTSRSASSEKASSTATAATATASGADSTASEMKVHFIDVGQADSILIQSDGHNMLVDGGNDEDGATVVSYLESQGVESLDYIIATHPHEDHVGGLDDVINTFDVEIIIAPQKESTTQSFESFLDAVSHKGLSLTAPIVGTTYNIGDASFTILSPNGDYGDELNDWSVGIKLVNGSNSFVMCGDAEENSEKDILDNGIDISADVLKIGHHGSSTSTSQSFLDAVNPTYAVISCGAGNDYGHPTAETLNKLAAKDIKLFRTDEQGTIIATSDGTTITWNVDPVADTAANPGTTTSSESGSTASTAAASTTSSVTASSEVAAPSTPATSEDSTPASATTSVESSTSETTSTTYVLNTNTKKFHRSGCRYVKQIKASNYATSDNRDEIIAEGYEPCKVCDP